MQKVRREAVRPVVGSPALHDSAFPRSLILLTVELDQQTEPRAFGESRASLSSGGIRGQKARMEEKAPTWLLFCPGLGRAGLGPSACLSFYFPHPPQHHTISLCS